MEINDFKLDTFYKHQIDGDIIKITWIGEYEIRFNIIEDPNDTWRGNLRSYFLKNSEDRDLHRRYILDKKRYAPLYKVVNS